MKKLIVLLMLLSFVSATSSGKKEYKVIEKIDIYDKLDNLALSLDSLKQSLNETN